MHSEKEVRPWKTLHHCFYATAGQHPREGRQLPPLCAGVRWAPTIFAMNRLVHHKEFTLHGLFLEVRDATGHWREELPWMVLHRFKRSIAGQLKCITQKSLSFTEQNYKEIRVEAFSKTKMHWHTPYPVRGKNYRGTMRAMGQCRQWASVDE